MRNFTCYDEQLGGIKLEPFSNVSFLLDQIDALQEHSRQHRAPDGIGWTKLFRLDAPPEPLETLAMPAERFRELLRPFAPPFDTVTVTSEFGPAFADEDSFIGFGPSDKAGIFAECADGKVKSIRCVLPGATAEENAVLADMLAALNSEHDLILVDWWMDVTVPLGIREYVEVYLATLLKLRAAQKRAANPATPAAPPPPDSRRPPRQSAAGAAPAGLSARLRRFLLRRWRRP